MLIAMCGVPTLLLLGFIWFPALATVGLSFTTWDGVGGPSAIEWAGVDNYEQVLANYPPFWPALQNNVVWLLMLAALPTPLGIFFAVLLEKQIRFSRFYRSALYLPVVLSLVLVGFITQLFLSQDQGFVNSALGKAGTGPDWLGDPDLNLWMVLIAASWRHTGYVMVLYLAGLKSVDPSLRDAAKVDGAGEWQAFRHVIFPALRPINIVVLVVTAIEALRAFDIVYVVNGGTNGLELLGVLVHDNIVGEASRIGYGSAIGVILLALSLGPIITYLVQASRWQQRS